MEGLISVTDLYRGNILDGTKNELMSIIGDVFKK